MRIPRATYRLQFHSGFTFEDAASILIYLSQLGISDIYASPVFKARRGSPHGYDVVDPAQISPELGGEEALRRLVGQARAQGLGWIQDIVPNHMAYDAENQMLMDIFENGEDSPFFSFFDISWDHVYENMRGRVLAPLLGKLYAEALESGELRLGYDERGLHVRYFERVLPLRIESYVTFLEHDLKRLEEKLGAGDADFMKLLGAARLFKTLAARTGDTDQSEQVRHTKKMLWALYNGNPQVRQFVDENLAHFNGTAGEAESFEALDRILSEQRYRLSFWKVAAEEINYRRFFTVNELISLRVEDEAVFEATHALILRLLQEGVFDGLRIDHIDGLYDPSGYLARLREKAAGAYCVVEKILAPGEELPAFWDVQGTTGYDFLNAANGLLCRREAAKAFGRLYRAFTRCQNSYDELVAAEKRLIISKHLAGNIDNLAHHLKRISSRDRYGRDVTLYGLRRALVEIMASFPVYRTYISHKATRPQDIFYIRTAIETAQRRLPGYAHEIDFIEKFLTLRFPERLGWEDKEEWIGFAMNFQQYTGPLMAKGFEDTVLYVYNPLIALNEVGADPERFGLDAGAFHAFQQHRQAVHPHSLNATATHDTKRGEDARARLNVLSEMPAAWEERIKRWSKMNKKKKAKAGGPIAPDANDEYFFYQALLGAFPFGGADAAFAERLGAFAVKAVREAKRHTAWIKPDEAYEEACVGFVKALLEDREGFLKDFLPFQRTVAFYGVINSLSQVLLKAASPGVPDFYQGTELWDFSFVDPDNRRPVDYGARLKVLAGIRERVLKDTAGLAQELLARKEDGAVKLFTVYQLLQARRRHPGLFEKGDYAPLAAAGEKADHAFAFLRRHEDQALVAVLPRFPVALVEEGTLPLGAGVWKETRLEGVPAGAWQDALTGRVLESAGTLPLAEVLASFPVALLVKR